MTFIVIGCSSNSSSSEDSWPFTAEVEEFVEIYVKHGGEKLEGWVGEDEVPPAEASLRRFEVTEGLEMDLVAAEPLISQPIDLHFDERGRLWVVQYRQYPFPAGLTINFYDQYLRAGFDGSLSAPPDHVRGADKITVLEDTDGDGVFDSSEDVITGLNMTTSVLVSHGGVWVLSPPHLLFYPDSDGDGLPEGEPEVHLEGFGLEDAHALANSLELGPDGWIYGVQGSTTTAEVKDIAFAGQALWRYHPGPGDFELFAEGSSNLFTLDFDRKGRAFSGMNGGGARGFHWVQGGRYRKNFKKHGPLTTPYAYGYFNQMEHEGYKERFSMTLTIYEEGRLPGYEGQMISGMAMTNRIQATKLIKDGSTFKTIDTDSLVTTSERSFRPVDMEVGPDGAVYIADWCDIRMDHVDPRDTWDPCGRIWRLQANDHRPVAPFNLAGLSSKELVELLSDERAWYRGQARRLLGERKDRSVAALLRTMAEDNTGQLALEALWAVHLIEGIDQGWARQLLGHPDESVRAWTVRLLGDGGSVSAEVRRRLIKLAQEEPSPVVRSQLASSSRRLPAGDALPLLRALMGRAEDAADKHIPLLIWWALEDKIGSDPEAVMNFLEDIEIWQTPIFEQYLTQRIARRLAAERGDNPSYRRIDRYDNWMEYARHPRSRMPGGKGDYTGWETNFAPEISDRNLTRLARLFELVPDSSHTEALLAGAERGLAQGPPLQRVPSALAATIDSLWTESTQTPALIAAAARLNHPQAKEQARLMAARPEGGEAERERMAGVATADRGEQLYLTHCADCHQTDGRGMERLAAPLRGSPWVLGREEALTRIVVDGLRGELLMPPAGGTLDDEEVAAVLSYIRSAWGHEAGPVSAGTVEEVRASSEERQGPWTKKELSAFKGEK